MLSNSSKYAIRGVLFLALNSDSNTKFSPKEIGEVIEVPIPFLAKTLQLLTKRSLISSTKGRKGGFYLTIEDKRNSLISIVDCIDGLEKFQNCMLGLPVCSNQNPCPIHHKLSLLRKNLIEELSSKSIEELANEIRLGKAHII